MSDEDFLNYYQYPLDSLAADGWDCLALFPYAAREPHTPERQKAMNALWRFYKAGLLLAPEGDEVLLNEIKELGVSDREDWMNPIIDSSYEAADWINSFSDLKYLIDPATGEEKTEGYYQPVNPDFRSALSKIFTEAGVGFEKGDVWPPQNEV